MTAFGILLRVVCDFIYIYMYTHTHTHTHFKLHSVMGKSRDSRVRLIGFDPLDLNFCSAA